MTYQQTKTKLAELLAERRRAGERRRAEQWRRLTNIWRGRLTKLCQLRTKADGVSHGTHHLPDNSDGRAMLQALLRFGLTAESAMTDAPWCEASELKKLQRAARRMKWNDVGALIGLTYDEREACKLWRLVPCDVTAAELERRKADKRRKADRERRQKKRRERREAMESMRNATKRDDAILRMLDKAAYRTPDGSFGYEWMPVSAMMKDAQECKAFRSPDGWRLRNLRDAMHVELKILAKWGAIQKELRDGRRGKVLWVRKLNLEEPVPVGKADTFSDGRSVGGEKRPKLTVIQGG